MRSIDELSYWNSRTYGSALRVPRRTLRLAFVLFCFLTPATNWMLPLTGRIVKEDIVLRHEKDGIWRRLRRR